MHIIAYYTFFISNCVETNKRRGNKKVFRTNYLNGSRKEGEDCQLLVNQSFVQERSCTQYYVLPSLSRVAEVYPLCKNGQVNQQAIADRPVSSLLELVKTI